MCTRKSMFNVSGVRGYGWVVVLGAVLCASTASFAQNMGPVTRVKVRRYALGIGLGPDFLKKMGLV